MLEIAESMCLYCHLLDEQNKATGGIWERFRGLPAVAKHMALTFTCYICAKANEKLSEQIVLEIKTTSSGKSKERRASQHSENGRVSPGTASLWHEGKDQWDSPVRQKEIPPLEFVARFGPKGYHQVQILSSCQIYKAGSNLSRTSSIGTARSWEPILPKGLGFADKLAK